MPIYAALAALVLRHFRLSQCSLYNLVFLPPDPWCGKCASEINIRFEQTAFPWLILGGSLCD